MVDADGDGFASDVDCNDANAEVHPGAPEHCDAQDEDCDGVVDAGEKVVGGVEVFPDLDGDGWGVAAGSRRVCWPPVPEFSVREGDCNDQDALAYPGADERCNARDDDCDREVDEGWSADGTLWYADQDGDGYGDSATAARACSAPGGPWALIGDDCDDARPDSFPGARDWCDDGSDQDCDGADRACPFSGLVALGDEEWVVGSDGETVIGYSGYTALFGNLLAIEDAPRAGVFTLGTSDRLRVWGSEECDIVRNSEAGRPTFHGWLGRSMTAALTAITPQKILNSRKSARLKVVPT